MHWMYYLLKNWSIGSTLLLQTLFGNCVCFAREGMFVHNLGSRKFFFVYDPDMMEMIMTSNSTMEKGFHYMMVKQLFKEGLITSTGKKWHARRKQLTPAFHFKILKEFIPVFNKHAKIFMKRIEDLMQKESSADIVPLVRLCTLDIILETAMGKTANTRGPQVHEYTEALNTWRKCLMKRVIFPLLWPDFIFVRTETGKTSTKCLDIMENFTRQVISDRLREKSERLEDISDNDVTPSSSYTGRKTKQPLAFLDLLLHLHMEDSNSLSLQDIVDEVDTFVSAGHDTTSTAISWALYLLGLYQDIQRKAQEEIDIILGDDDERTITTEDIRKMKYLHCVIKETLRLYPSIPLISRNANEDLIANGNKIDKGAQIIIPIYMIHRNPQVFPNPEEFNPDRFSRNNLNMHPFAYIPFSAGYRNCIGQKFAVHEMITVLATVLRHFNVTSIEHRDKIKFRADIVLTSENGIHLKFTKRLYLRSYSN